MNVEERIYHKVRNFQFTNYKTPTVLYLHPALKSELYSKVQPWMLYSVVAGEHDIYMGMKIIEVYAWDYLEVH